MAQKVSVCPATGAIRLRKKHPMRLPLLPPRALVMESSLIATMQNAWG